MTQLRSYSSALVGLLLWSTSSHAEGSPFDPALFLDSTEPTYVAQLLEGDVPQAAHMELAAAISPAPNEETTSALEIEGQLDFTIPHWIVLQDHEGDDFVFVSLGLDGSLGPEETGSTSTPGLALDGYEDR